MRKKERNAYMIKYMRKRRCNVSESEKLARLEKYEIEISFKKCERAKYMKEYRKRKKTSTCRAESDLNDNDSKKPGNSQSSKNEMKNIVHKRKKTSTCRTDSYLNVNDSKKPRNGPLLAFYAPSVFAFGWKKL